MSPLIKIDPEIMCGRACVAGTRIPVYSVLFAVANEGSIEGAKKHYSYLTTDQIKAAIEWAGEYLDDNQPAP